MKSTFVYGSSQPLCRKTICIKTNRSYSGCFVNTPNLGWIVDIEITEFVLYCFLITKLIMQLFIYNSTNTQNKNRLWLSLALLATH